MTICGCFDVSHKTAGRAVLSLDWQRNEHERGVAKVLEDVAAEAGAPNIQAGDYSWTRPRNIRA